VKSAKAKRPDADVLGVTVQKMVDTRNGTELIVGAKCDPVFGAILLVGMGGVTAELYADRALGLPPLNERLARRMVESLKSYPLLRGYRGRPLANLDKLMEVLMRFSYLVADHPEISELDINPLLVGPKDVIALDARVVVDTATLGQPAPRKYSHLAIRPYPEELVTETKLKDGTEVVLRPIRPEDEQREEAPVQDGDGSDAMGQGAEVGVSNWKPSATSAEGTVITSGGQRIGADASEEDDDGALKPLPERLIMELTAHRTLALREAIGR
ncbi:MAG TPA: acetate--CoA ligase family protein, partial [Anaerolineales bacterium]|nr:acetate--CoA ligase family protein [Anaerolineales bacterium]